MKLKIVGQVLALVLIVAFQNCSQDMIAASPELATSASESVNLPDDDLSNGDLSNGDLTKQNVPDETNTFCVVGDKTIPVGSLVQMYFQKSVPYGSSCSDLSEIRVCSRYGLTGAAPYTSCKVQPPASCTFNGKTVTAGATVTAYERSTVPYGQSCKPATLTCNNGEFSPDLSKVPYASCTVGAPAACQVAGTTLAHGLTKAFYTKSSADYGEKCPTVQVSCSNGIPSTTQTVYTSCKMNPLPKEVNTTPTEEDSLKQLVVQRALHIASYDRYKTYAPSRTTEELPAVTIATYGQLYIKAYQLASSSADKTLLLSAAEQAAKSLIKHSDMNKDGKVGWGRYWPEEGIHGNGDGSYTYWPTGSCKRNSAYENESFDEARVIQFLAELASLTRNQVYLKGVRQAVKDEWGDGGYTSSGQFFYWKTSGDCAKGWEVKNTNMQYGAALYFVYRALLKLTPNDAFRFDVYRRADDVLHSDLSELKASNFGYYGKSTMQSKASSSSIRLTQHFKGNRIECVTNTASGDSCYYHYAVEMRALMDVQRSFRGSAVAANYDMTAPVNTLYSKFKEGFKAHCSAAKSSGGSARNSTSCTVPVCLMRKQKSDFPYSCKQLIDSLNAGSVDILITIADF